MKLSYEADGVSPDILQFDSNELLVFNQQERFLMFLNCLNSNTPTGTPLVGLARGLRQDRRSQKFSVMGQSLRYDDKTGDPGVKH